MGVRVNHDSYEFVSPTANLLFEWWHEEGETPIHHVTMTGDRGTKALYEGPDLTEASRAYQHEVDRYEARDLEAEAQEERARLEPGGV